MSDDRYVFLPMPQALAGPPHGFVLVYSCRWWLVCPERGLRFYNPMKTSGRRRERGLGSPQCNSSRSVVESFAKPSDEIIYIERVFFPVNLDDWVD